MRNDECIHLMSMSPTDAVDLVIFGADKLHVCDDMRSSQNTIDFRVFILPQKSEHHKNQSYYGPRGRSDFYSF